MLFAAGCPASVAKPQPVKNRWSNTGSRDALKHDPARLLSLPNEVLFLVLSFVDDISLYRLSLLCRRLHVCALPIYLGRCGIQGVTDLSKLSHVSLLEHLLSASALRGLRISIYTTSIEHLECKFHFPEDMLLWQVRSLYRILTYVKRIDKATLDFMGLPKMLTINGIPRLKPIEEWRDVFHRIFQMCLQRSCSGLVIRGGDFLCEQYLRWLDYDPPQHRPYSVSQPLVGMRRFFGILAGKPVAQPITNFSLNTSHAMQNAKNPRPDDVSVLFSLGLLNKSKISNLSVESTVLRRQSWADVVQDLTLPSLTRLSVDSCNIPFKDLIIFFERHPSITVLSLKETIGRPFPILELSTTLLRNLTTLHAPVDIVVHLLNSVSILPKLTSVVLTSHVSVDSDLSFIDHSLATIPRNAEGKTWGLELYVHTGNWFSVPHNTSTKHLYLSQILQCISHLRLDAGWYGLDASQRRRLPQWLESFPMLHKVTITDLSRWPYSEVSLASEFAQLIISRCNAISTVVINGEVFDYSGNSSIS